MKKILLFTCLIFAIWSCEEDTTPQSECIQVRLVDEICGNAILQIVDPDFNSLGQATWQDSNGQSWSNVFSTTLTCVIDQVPTGGTSFFINIEAELPQGYQDCVTCLANFSNAPEVFHYVRIQTNCAGISHTTD
jgi:hypothetical protein